MVVLRIDTLKVLHDFAFRIHSVQEFSGQPHESAIGIPSLFGESVGVFSPGLLLPFSLLSGILLLL